jgi:hypothetical protein
LATFTGAFNPADLKLAKPVVSTAKVSLGFEGTIGADGNYQPALGERAEPVPSVSGGVVPEPRKLRLSGDSAVS